MAKLNFGFPGSTIPNLNDTARKSARSNFLSKNRPAIGDLQTSARDQQIQDIINQGFFRQADFDARENEILGAGEQAETLLESRATEFVNKFVGNNSTFFLPNEIGAVDGASSRAEDFGLGDGIAALFKPLTKGRVGGSTPTTRRETEFFKRFRAPAKQQEAAVSDDLGGGSPVSSSVFSLPINSSAGRAGSSSIVG
ncbi:MAG: hypothetical protein JKY94_00925 [Rhodobacteraceae bacterium]|nr:hypothetical protein [Paracoccaceae bacterium]